MTTNITEARPTINAIAVDQEVPRHYVTQAIANRGVPVKDNRVERSRLADVILEIGAIQRRAKAYGQDA